MRSRAIANSPSGRSAYTAHLRHRRHADDPREDETKSSPRERAVKVVCLPYFVNARRIICGSRDALAYEANRGDARMTWWPWMIAGAILLGAELSFVSAQLYLVFVGSAAILVGLIALAVPLPEWLQWALFAVLALVSMVTFRSRIYRRFHTEAPPVKTGPAGGVITLVV